MKKYIIVLMILAVALPSAFLNGLSVYDAKTGKWVPYGSTLPDPCQAENTSLQAHKAAIANCNQRAKLLAAQGRSLSASLAQLQREEGNIRSSYDSKKVVCKQRIHERKSRYSDCSRRLSRCRSHRRRYY